MTIHKISKLLPLLGSRRNTLLVFLFFFNYNNIEDDIMKFIESGNIKNKKVLLRCDLNVSIKEGHIIDTTKIKESIKTIEFLLDNNCSMLKRALSST